MILYTPLPREMIFPEEDYQDIAKHQMYNLDGIPLLVEPDGEGAFRIVRVMSTDPAHYMDERCAPGAKISFF